MKTPTLDKEGYPTEETLEAIKKWDIKDIEGCLQFISDAWYYEDGAKKVRDGIWTFATCGWSGNESLLYAFYESMVWLMLSWQSIQLSGGFLCIAYNNTGKKEMDKKHREIVNWGWKEK